MRKCEKAYVPPKKRIGGHPPAQARGDADEGPDRWRRSRIEQEYRTPIEHHNPMECLDARRFGAMTASPIYDKTQARRTATTTSAASSVSPRTRCAC